jgi:amidase
MTPGASTPAFDVNLRMPAAIDGKKLEHYLGASLITAAPTMMGLPAIAVPCGFDQWGRPVGLQIIGRHRGEAALLQAAAVFESEMGLAQGVPIDPRPGTAVGLSKGRSHKGRPVATPLACQKALGAGSPTGS